MNTQSKKFSRLLLAASISFASFTLIACSDSDDDVKTNITNPDDNNDSKAADYYLAKYEDALTPTTAVSWDVTDHDERVRKLEVNGDKLVVLNRWYNGIVQVATNSNEQKVTPIGFAALTTAGHHVESTDEDYVSGASEHLLLDAWYADDNSAMYALVNKPRSTVAEDDTYGLFKVPLNADGSVPSSQVKGKTVYHRESGVVRVGDGMGDNSMKLTAALPLSDGKVLAFDENHKAVATFSKDLVLDQANSFALADNSEIQEWVANDDGVYLLIKDGDGKLILEKRDTDNLTKVAEKVEVASGGSLEANDASDYVALVGGTNVQLFDADLKVAKSFALTSKAEGASLSTDGKRLAVATEKEGELVLIDFAQKMSSVTAIKLDKGFRTFALGDKDTLFISSESGKVEKVALTGQPKALTANELLQVALENITAETLNHGYDGSAVRYNLALPTNKSGGLPNVSYEWSSSSSAVNAADGSIVKPAKGTAPTPTTLSLKATATVDGKSASGDKSVQLSVLPEVTEVQYNREIKINNATDDQNYRVMAANNDGSKLAAFVRREGKVLVVDTATNTQTMVDLPAPYNKSDAPFMYWKDATTLLVVADKSDDEHKKGAILSLNTADNSWTTAKALEAAVYNASVSSDNASLSVQTQTKGADGKEYHLATYKVSDFTEISNYKLDGRLRTLVTNATGKIAYTASVKHVGTGANHIHVFNLYRYSQGKKDFDVETDGYYFSLKQVGDKLVAGDHHGDFSVVNNAFSSNPPASNAVMHIKTARNGYDGVSYPSDHHYGRTYNIEANNDTVITMFSNVGISTYKFNGTTYIEDKFVADKDLYRFVTSGDKSKAFAYNRTAQTFNVLNLN